MGSPWGVSSYTVSASTSQVSDQAKAEALRKVTSGSHDTCLLLFPGALLA